MQIELDKIYELYGYYFIPLAYNHSSTSGFRYKDNQYEYFHALTSKTSHLLRLVSNYEVAQLGIDVRKLKLELL